MSATHTTHAPDAAQEVALAITGMTCSGCVNAVTRALSRVPGVSHVQVDLDTGRAQVAGTASAETLLGAVARAGYDATLAEG